MYKVQIQTSAPKTDTVWYVQSGCHRAKSCSRSHVQSQRRRKIKNEGLGEELPTGEQSYLTRGHHSSLSTSFYQTPPVAKCRRPSSERSPAGSGAGGRPREALLTSELRCVCILHLLQYEATGNQAPEQLGKRIPPAWCKKLLKCHRNRTFTRDINPALESWRTEPWTKQRRTHLGVKEQNHRITE